MHWWFSKKCLLLKMADLLFDVGFLSYFPFCLKEAKVDKLKKGMEAKA